MRWSKKKMRKLRRKSKFLVEIKGRLHEAV